MEKRSITLLKSRADALKARIQDFKISRIKWFHDGKELAQADRKGCKRGSAIISVLSEDIQRKVMRNGIVLDSILD